jgi:YidC/Oxa1 family membrane protein insertase
MRTAWAGIALVVASLGPAAASAQAAPLLSLSSGQVEAVVRVSDGAVVSLLLKDGPATSVTGSAANNTIRLIDGAMGEEGRFVWRDPAGTTIPRSGITGKLLDVSASRSRAVVMWEDPGGLTLRRTYRFVDDYLLEVVDTLTNTSDSRVDVTPWGELLRVRQQDRPTAFNVREGGVRGTSRDGVVNVEHLRFDRWERDLPNPADGLGWIGFTDRHWLTALLPGKESAQVSFGPSESTSYEVRLRGATSPLAPGESRTFSQTLLSVPKSAAFLKSYEDSGFAPGLSQTIDWGGPLVLLTRPLMWALNELGGLLGSYGLAIVVLTVAIRLVLAPLAHQGFRNVHRMRRIRPQVAALRREHPGRAADLQKALAALYRREKVRPLAGVLPLLLQLPIVLALFQVLTVDVNLRRQSWGFWIRDLSAPETVSVASLAGLADLPFLALLPPFGVLAAAYALLLFLQQSTSGPRARGPLALLIRFGFPTVMLLLVAASPAGLLLYWVVGALIALVHQRWVHRYEEQSFSAPTAGASMPTSKGQIS